MSEETSGRGEIVPPRGGEPHGSANEAEHVEFRELMAIERARIESADRRTDVVRQMIHAQLEQNSREYEFASRKMEADERREKRRLSLFTRIVVSGGIVLTVAVGVLMAVSFFGDASSSTLAQRWTTALFQSLGGGALIVVVGKLLQSLLRR